MSTWIRINEHVFRDYFYQELDTLKFKEFDFVTGPGRSGAIASVYASHYLSIPFIPHKTGSYGHYRSCLIVDTVVYTGKTLKKSANWHMKQGLNVTTLWGMTEHRGHYYKMWYEYDRK